MHECVDAPMPCVRQGNPLDWLDGRMGLQGAKDPPSRAKPTKSVSEANPLRWVAPCYALAWHRRRCMNAPIIFGGKGGRSNPLSSIVSPFRLGIETTFVDTKGMLAVKLKLGIAIAFSILTLGFK